MLFRSRVNVFEPPPFARNDVGVYSGADVPPYYDSLLAKLIVSGPDRPTAVERLAEALRSYRIDGVKTNLDLLLAIAEDPAFRAGDLHTGYLPERRIVETLRDVPPEAIAAAAAADFAASLAERPADPWRGPGAWRVGRVDQPSDWLAGDRLFEARVDRSGCAAAIVRVEDAVLEAEPLEEREGERVVRVGVTNALVRSIGANERRVQWQERTHRLRRRPAPSVDEARGAHGGGSGSLVAPMPGRVVRVAVQEGQRVHANQTLVVLEAMKMEHVVEAPHDGVVRRVLVGVGDQVAGDDLLVELGEEG